MNTRLNVLPKVALIASIALALSACGGDDDVRGLARAPGSVAPLPSAPPPAPPIRSLRAIPTADPANLIYDPSFLGLGAQYSTGILSQGTKAELYYPRDNPGGPSTSVLFVTKTSREGAVYLGAQGGKGPLEASVWIALSDGGTVNVALVSFGTEEQVLLTPVPGSEQKFDAATFVKYTARTEGDMLGQLFLAAEAPKTGSLCVAVPNLRMTDAKKSLGTAAIAPKVPLANLFRSASALARKREPGPAKPAPVPWARPNLPAL